MDFIVYNALGHTIAECRELCDAVAVCERNRADGRPTALQHEPTGAMIYTADANVAGAAMLRWALSRLEAALADADAKKKAREEAEFEALPVHPEYGRTCNPRHSVVVDGVTFRIYKKRPDSPAPLQQG